MRNKRILTFFVVFIFMFSFLSGCTTKKQQEPASASTSTEITITDQIGRTVTLEKPAEKIVSSYYISTAALIALGMENNLVGIEAKADTRELYRLAAPSLLDLPAIGSGKGVNVEEIASLNPDVVILPQKLQDSVSSFESLGIPVIVVDPETMDNFKECVSILGAITDTAKKSEALLSYYDEKMTEAKEKTASLSVLPTVYLSAGSEFLSTCTSKMYQNELIAMSGGINVSSELTNGYWQQISAEQLNIWAPEYIFAVSYADYTLDDIKNNAAFSEIPAIKNGNVYSFPSNIEPWDYPTPSSVLGVLYLTHMLHPEIYSEEDYVQEATDFYKEFFDISVSKTDLGL
ncbi:ABC transporter substrate-binding protein [Anaerotignum sp.]|uniref:ABC transporter substrate-binding protein n=1 Tax=Anaerotignum sp. TaxID=2039241 RepID=UPI0028A879CA|nr:ABC transporter substrate-binding protein [Anaerotignum sp.]